MPKSIHFRFPESDIFLNVTIKNWKIPIKYFFFCFRTASLGGKGLEVLGILVVAWMR